MPLINFFKLQSESIKTFIHLKQLINEAEISKKIILITRNNCFVALVFKMTEISKTKNVNKLLQLAGLSQNMALVTCRYAPF